METITEELGKEIQIPCYLCGKGKITMRQGDIIVNSPHHIDRKIKLKLEKHLLKCTEKWFKKLN